MATNKKYDPGVEITTPVGTLKFPWLQKPQEQFQAYSCELLLTPDEAAPLIKQLDDLYKKNLQKQAILNDVEKIKGAAKPWKDDVDFKTKEPTGLLSFKCKAKAKRGDYDFKPRLFEANGLPFGHVRNEDGNVVPVNPIPAIGFGTKAILCLKARGYYFKGEAGISLNLEAAQILKLQQAGRNSAEDYGFTPKDMPTESEEGTQDETGGAF